MPDAHVEYETGGWGVVEEPLGTPSLRSTAFGMSPNSEVIASLGFFDFSESLSPQASIWVRYALRRDSQDFLVVARTENGDVEFVVLEAIGSDLTNGQFERIDLDLEPLAGLNQVQLMPGRSNG